MVFDILKHLPPERREKLRRKIDAEQCEVTRLHGLPDRWLGEAILSLARTARRRIPRYQYPDDPHGSYNSDLMWQVAPEIARRLGCRLLPNEATHIPLIIAGPTDLRESASVTIKNISLNYMKEGMSDDDLCPVTLLCRDIANGSPVAIALDRVAPPSPTSGDWCARYIREISRYRGVGPFSGWTPAMQNYEKNSNLFTEDEADTGISPSM